MADLDTSYPANFSVEYVEQHDRMSSFFRIALAAPIVALLIILSASGGGEMMNEAGKEVSQSSLGIGLSLTAATALMIIFRQKYPKWWFEFAQELNRFSARIFCYILLLTDRYPSTTDSQAVTLNYDYPNVEKDLNRWLPLVKWFLAIPHYIALGLLSIAVVGLTFLAWLSILFTGRYPKGIFDFVVGVGKWSTRVEAYTTMLVTDKYPPFSLK